MRTRSWSRAGRTVAVLAAASLVAVGCTDDGGRPAASGGDDGGRTFLGVRGAPVSLVADRSCDDVLADFQSFAPEVLEAQFFGFGRTGEVAVDVAEGDFDTAADDSGAATESAAAPAADGAALAGGSAGSGTSETNTQERGIDEPDVVETDGDYVYLVDAYEQDRLVILDGTTAEVVGRLDLGTWGTQILLQGDRILAVSGGGGYAVAGGPAIDVVEPELVDPALVGPSAEDVKPADDVDVPAATTVDPAPEPGQPEPFPLPTEPPGFQAGTVIQLIDVSDRSAPRIVESTEVEGWHVSTRVVEGVARIVVSSYPEAQAFVEEPMVAFEQDGQEAAADALVAATAASSIEDWLPSFRTTTATDTGGATSLEGPLVACEDVFVPEQVNAGIAETSVLRVDFAEGFDPADTTTIVAEASTVYASAQTLYVGANQWVAPDQQGSFGSDDYATAIHAFDLRGDGAAAHLGAGTVPGHVLNQYSLSEWDGHLRVATTEGAPWDGSGDSESGVHVLRLDGSELRSVGSVTGLGVTETIQSVRFMGPVGYVVTFRQTDPLYVIDLADPANPAAVGELKIPGFSSYLHPAGEGRLIGVGRDADLEGRDQGFLVSLFDVSDPTNPTQLQTHVERDAWSYAGNDPKAFLYWAPESAIAIPIERYQTVEPEPQPVEPEPRPVEPLPVEPGQEQPGADEPADVDVATEGDVIGPDGFQTGITVLDISDAGIDERGTVTYEGRYPSRAIVVQGRLWSLFDGGVAISDFGAVESATYHDHRSA